MKTSNKADAPHINKLQRLLITKTATVFGVLDAVVLFTFFSIRPILHTTSAGEVMFVLGFNAVIWTLAGLFFRNSMEKQFRRRDKIIGLELTAQDKIDLYVWTKYGVKPTSKRLRPVLTKYLDYMEWTNKRSKVLPFFIGGAVILGMFTLANALAIINGTNHLSDHVADLVFWGVLFLAILASGWRSIKLPQKYRRMRQQLAKKN